MTRLLARVMMWLALIAVIVVAGGHTFYYLMGWEWNRAAIAGVATVGGLILASSILLLGRLATVEAKLDLLLARQEAGTSRTGGTVPSRADPTAVEVQLEPRPDLPWLSRPPALVVGLLAVAPREVPDTAVFIPVFLAAGLIISVLAGAVERVAALVQGRRAPRVGATAATSSSRTRGRPPPLETLRSQPRWLLALVPFLGAMMIGGAIGGLYWASHYWSEPIGPGVTTMTVVVDVRGPTTTDSDIVETMGRFCTVDTGTGITFAGVAPGPEAGTILLRLEPLLDEDAQVRYIGCLEDAVLEWHRLTVTATQLDPA